LLLKIKKLEQMDKKVKIALGIAGGVILVGTAIWLITKEKPIESEETIIDTVVSGAASSVASVLPICQREATFPLKQGSQGKQVKELQNFLNTFGSGNKITADCDFGGKTKTKLETSFRDLGFSGQVVDKYFYDSVIVLSNRNGKLQQFRPKTSSILGLK
jgi:hypothetical protein